ncbi:MAG: carbohydrate ABC transporter permease [Clostridia bacterium]|nr:carbohydrate ABC transporter permease [Clostridia bacterium]
MVDMIWNNIWQFLLPLPLSVLLGTWYPYVISRFKFRGRNIIYAVIMFRMIIPIVGTGGAWFKLYQDLGLYNNPLFFIVGSLGSGGTTFLLYYGFFKNLPMSYAEAVYIDGGGEFTVFFKIMLPQAIPMITVLLVNAFIASWNDAMTSLLYMPSYLTISAGMYSVQNTLLRTGKTSIYYAGLVTAMIPMLLVFLVFSNKMMTSLSVGGLKG